MLKRLTMLVAIVWVWVGGIARASGYPWHELYAPANIPNWALAALAGWAGGMALRTLWAIRKQTELQAAGMKQWVDVQVTSTSIRERYPTTRDGDSLAKSIGVHFCASNKTSYPLTIKEVLVYISPKRAGEPKWEQYTRTEEIILAPKSDETATGRVSMSDHNFAVSLDLDVAQAAQYNAHTLHFSVTGSIRFKPAIGDPEDQGFSFMVKSGPNLTRPLMGFSELKRGEEA